MYEGLDNFGESNLNCIHLKGGGAVLLNLELRETNLVGNYKHLTNLIFIKQN